MKMLNRSIDRILPNADTYFWQIEYFIIFMIFWQIESIVILYIIIIVTL